MAFSEATPLQKGRSDELTADEFDVFYEQGDWEGAKTSNGQKCFSTWSPEEGEDVSDDFPRNRNGNLGEKKKESELWEHTNSLLAVKDQARSVSEFEDALQKISTLHERSPSRPAIKVINQNNFFGLWIADDNKSKMKVTDEKAYENMSISFEIQSFKQPVPGRLFRRPRLVICHVSPLLMKPNTFVLETRQMGNVENGKTDNSDLPPSDFGWIGVRLFDSNVWKAAKNDLYICRMFLVLFVDENNRPIHEHPVQLTAKKKFSKCFFEMYEKFVLEACECKARSYVNFRERNLKPEKYFTFLKSGDRKHVQTDRKTGQKIIPIPFDLLEVAFHVSKFVFCPEFDKGQSDVPTKPVQFCKTTGFQSLTVNTIYDFIMRDLNVLMKIFNDEDSWWCKKKISS
jgi:hypothetical protein